MFLALGAGDMPHPILLFGEGAREGLSCPVLCQVISRSAFPVVVTENTSPHPAQCHRGGKNHPQLKTTGLNPAYLSLHAASGILHLTTSDIWGQMLVGMSREL